MEYYKIGDRLLPGSAVIDGTMMSKVAISNLLRDCWSLPQSIGGLIEHYYLRSWEGSWLKQQVSGAVIPGTIYYQGDTYSIVWNVLPFRAYAAKSLLLSFRGSQLYGHYVLIRIKGEIQ